MYIANNIARYIIDYSWDKGKTVSNLRLQKILYFVQAEFLVTKDHPCFEENIYAWDFGPVVPHVYYEYKMYGGASIPSNGTDGNEYGISVEDKKMINDMVDQCNNYSTSALVRITHNQEPWKYAMEMTTSRIISTESIKEYFSEE